ncbi:hypothetical protein CI238_00985 [Colletotrichum incanum]|uniref:Mid2 domain-containing protein n=1 Tax=Colletotrichum incanum TaxID=1573173 RepID=A0A161Y6P9_COLIC|nr:hypothetical protein CI238_00985 [Colletotrichum incanum]
MNFLLIMLLVAGSLSKAQLVLGDQYRDGGDQPFNVTSTARTIAEMLTVLTPTVPQSIPLITPKPVVVAERDVSLLQVETLGSNTCGFFMLSKDNLKPASVKMYPHHVPPLGAILVAAQGRIQPASTAKSPCAPPLPDLVSRRSAGMFTSVKRFQNSRRRAGESQQLMGFVSSSHKTRGLNGECQTFIRDDGALGEKTLLGCREADTVWDPIVSLKTATDQFSETSTTVATSVVPISSMPPDTPSPPIPTLPAASVATPATAPGTSTNSSDSTHPHTGAIIGGVLGGLAILAIASCVAVWLVVRRRRASALGRGPDGHLSPSPSHELPGGQPCVAPKEGGKDRCSYKALSPASTSREMYQAPANDAVGSPMKPAELD